MIPARQHVRQCVPSHLSAHTAHIDKEDARPSGAPLHNLLSRSELLHLHVGGGSHPGQISRTPLCRCSHASTHAPRHPRKRIYVQALHICAPSCGKCTFWHRGDRGGGRARTAAIRPCAGQYSHLLAATMATTGWGPGARNVTGVNRARARRTSAGAVMKASGSCAFAVPPMRPATRLSSMDCVCIKCVCMA